MPVISKMWMRSLLLPISVFKQRVIKTEEWDELCVFKSSGTGESGRSTHYVRDIDYYNMISLKIFQSFYPDHDYEILALLPSYLENGHSSLVQMARNLMQYYNEEKDSFYMYDFDALEERIRYLLERTDKKVVLLGVSFALIDFCESYKIKDPRLTVVFHRWHEEYEKRNGLQ